MELVKGTGKKGWRPEKMLMSFPANGERQNYWIRLIPHACFC